MLLEIDGYDLLKPTDYDAIAELEPVEAEKDRDSLIEELVILATLLAQKRIQTRRFQQRMAELLSLLHWSRARRLTSHIDPVTRKFLIDELKRQFYAGVDPLTGAAYGIDKLVQDILKGGVSEAQLKYRLQAFGHSDKLVAEFIKREQARSQGLLYGYRELAIADHCLSCPIYAAYPPLPIDELILPTEQCECGRWCKCQIVYMTLEQAISLNNRISDSSV